MLKESEHIKRGQGSNHRRLKRRKTKGRAKLRKPHRLKGRGRGNGAGTTSKKGKKIKRKSLERRRAGTSIFLCARPGTGYRAMLSLEEERN